MEYFEYNTIQTPEDRAAAVEELWGPNDGLPFISKDTTPLGDGEFVSSFDFMTYTI